MLCNLTLLCQSHATTCHCMYGRCLRAWSQTFLLVRPLGFSACHSELPHVRFTYPRLFFREHVLGSLLPTTRNPVVLFNRPCYGAVAGASGALLLQARI